MSVLERVTGRVLDADTHEFIPAHLWPEMFGDFTAPFAAFFTGMDADAVNSLADPVQQDNAPISEEAAPSMWGAAAHAPGAIDMARRLEVMDFFGVDRSLIFPSGPGMVAYLCASAAPEGLAVLSPEITEQLAALQIDRDALRLIGGQLHTLHNDWCIKTSQLSPRLRAVAGIDTTELEPAVAEIKRVVAGGVKAIGLPSGMAPGGMSPGHRDVDPLWAVLEENNVPALLHIGGDFGFVRQPVWSAYGDFNEFGKSMESPEANLNAYSFAQSNMSNQNFITAMIYGGVFDRFPRLGVGCIETSAYWVGPMSEHIDNVAGQFRRHTSKLSLRPSEYLPRNIRVTPFWWEPVDKYIERFGLEDVYVYGSDYPHFEGGKDPLHQLGERLERLGPEICEKFFVSNAALLMP